MRGKGYRRCLLTGVNGEIVWKAETDEENPIYCRENKIVVNSIYKLSLEVILRYKSTRQFVI